MIRITAGDPHISKDNLQDQEDFFHFLMSHEIFNTHAPVGGVELVLLGDIYCSKAIIRSEAQNYFIEKLKTLCTYFSRIYILVGNHDYNGPICVDHALEPIKLINRKIFVVDIPIVDQLTDSVFLPYIKTNEEFLNVITNYSNSGYNLQYVYGHQGIQGFDLGNGILDMTGVNQSQLPPNTQFIMGHYHKPQEKNNVIYVGSPLSHSWGESNQNKRILIQDFNNKQQIFLPIHHVCQHIDLKFDSVTEYWVPETEQYLKDDFSKDNIRITITGPKALSKKYGLEYFATKNLGPLRSLKLRYDYADVIQENAIDDSLSVESMLGIYLKQVKLERLYDLSIKYLKEFS